MTPELEDELLPEGPEDGYQTPRGRPTELVSGVALTGAAYVALTGSGLPLWAAAVGALLSGVVPISVSKIIDALDR